MTNLASIITLIIIINISKQWLYIQNCKNKSHSEKHSKRTEWQSDTVIHHATGNDDSTCFRYKGSRWIKMDQDCYTSIEMRPGMTIWPPDLQLSSQGTSAFGFGPSPLAAWRCPRMPSSRPAGMGHTICLGGDGWSGKHLYFTDVYPTQLSSIHLSVSKF